MYFLQDKFRVRLPPPRDANGNRPSRAAEAAASASSSSSSSQPPAHDLFSPYPPDVELVRDSFGLRKMIVVSTAAKKLIALDSETGFVIWRKFLADVRPFQVSSGSGVEVRGGRGREGEKERKRERERARERESE